MAKASGHTILSQRYAAAWIAAAPDADRRKLRDEVAALQSSLANDPRLVQLLDNPTVDRNAMANALMQVAAKAGMTKTTVQFLGVLANGRRQSLLSQILGDMEKQLDAADGIQHAHLTSAVQLPAKFVKDLQSVLSAQTQNDIRLMTDVDPELLGGIQVQMDSWLIDASLAGQLSRLERQLKSQTHAA